MDDSRLRRAQEVLGHEFGDPGLLRTALTHPSYAAENVDSDTYDRMEFLGDAIVGFVASEYVYAAFPGAPEGELSLRKHHVVEGSALAEAADRLGLAEFVAMGEGAKAAGDRRRSSVLENTMEAVIAAVYLDAGLEVARTLILRVLSWRLDSTDLPAPDPKSALQEWTQASGGRLPEYRIVGTEGPVHDRTFFAEVLVDGEVCGAGSGRSKQAAERAAAASAMADIRGAADS